MKKLTICLAVALCACLTFSACNKDKNSSSESSSSEETLSSVEISSNSSVTSSEETISSVEISSENSVISSEETLSSVEISSDSSVTSSEETISSVEISSDSSVTSSEDENAFTIYYEVNSPEHSEASVRNTTQTVRYGEAFTLEIPTCPGYDFVCWKKRGETTPFTQGTYLLQEDVTLVATWEIDEDDSYWWTENG